MINNPPLYELAYVSVATAPFDEAQLKLLLRQARTKNQTLDVTGMLLYADGTFFQVLEGVEKTVCTLYEQIRQDPRHTHCMLVHESGIATRNFPDWSMGFELIDHEQIKSLEGFSDLLESGSSLREVMQANPEASYQLLLSFSNCSGIVPTIE